MNRRSFFGRLFVAVAAVSALPRLWRRRESDRLIHRGHAACQQVFDELMVVEGHTFIDGGELKTHSEQVIRYCEFFGHGHLYLAGENVSVEECTYRIPS